MTQHIRGKACLVLLSTVALLAVFGFSVQPAFGEYSFDLELKSQPYPILGEGSQTKLAVELPIALYPEGTTMTSIKKELADLDESERMKIPEYLIIKEFELTKKEDKEGIVRLY